MRHTSGPWSNNDGRIEAANAFTSEAEVVATVGIVNQQTDLDMANATLIAAAPTLLEVAQEIAYDDRVDLVDSERRIRLYGVLQRAGVEVPTCW